MNQIIPQAPTYGFNNTQNIVNSDSNPGIQV